MGKNIKFREKFLAFLQDDILKTTFSIKSVSQLTTLCTFKWLKEYLKASPEQKKSMMEEMKKLRDDAEKNGYLHNSREIKDGEPE